MGDAEIQRVAPDGIDLVAEVAPGPNAQLDLAVLNNHGTIAVYANDGGATARAGSAATRPPARPARGP